jgi:phospholipase/lecithinase/hemolysin
VETKPLPADYRDGGARKPAAAPPAPAGPYFEGGVRGDAKGDVAMSRETIIAATAALAMTAGNASAASPFSAIYAFGDSLSDVGNVYLATNLATGGERPEPGAPYVGGQFSNGPVWVQDLAEMMGLPALTPSLLNGTDFAWGGATAGAGAAAVPSLLDQVGMFLSGKSRAPSNALYTISIGANDLFDILSGSAQPRDLSQIAGDVAKAAQALELAGARRLMLFGVPNLGLTPMILTAGMRNLQTEASSLTRQFNEAVLGDIAAEAPRLAVYHIDAYGLSTDVIGDPGRFGFANVTDPCWTGEIAGYPGGGSLCSELKAVQNRYLFWDSAHPTQAAHRLVAEAAAGLIGVILGFAEFGARKARTHASA